jgi:hypothetical protein
MSIFTDGVRFGGPASRLKFLLPGGARSAPCRDDENALKPIPFTQNLIPMLALLLGQVKRAAKGPVYYASALRRGFCRLEELRKVMITSVQFFVTIA